MFGVAAVSGKVERRALGRSSSWSRDQLPDRALARLGHAVAGQHEAARLMAAPETILLKATQAPSGACDARSVRTSSARHCQALILGVSPAAAVAIFSSASNPGLAMRTRLHHRPATVGTRSAAGVLGPAAPEDRLRPAPHLLCRA